MINCGLINESLINGPAFVTVTYEEIEAEPVAVERYLFTLSESGGTNPVTIPIASFQGQRKSGTSWLNVNIPSISVYADDIDARASGIMRIYRQLYDAVTGTQLDQQLIHQVTLTSVRSDRGPRNDTGTLSGSATYVPGTPRIIYLGGATYRQAIDGKRSFRMRPNSSLRPGDEAYVLETDEQFTVGEISYFVGVSQRQMYVSEAD